MSNVLSSLLSFMNSPLGAALVAEIPDLYTKVAAILVKEGHVTAEEIAAHVVTTAPGIAPMPEDKP